MESTHITISSPRSRALAREINRGLKDGPEVVLETRDIQTFLTNGEAVDGIDVMRLLRGMAERQHWTVFVFDHGALVRISGQPGLRHESARP